MKIYTSPIHYPGGKRWLTKRIFAEMCRRKEDTLLSPFFGGGSIELNLAAHLGTTIIAYDNCPFVVNFWQHFLDNPESVREKARENLRDGTLGPKYIAGHESHDDAAMFLARNHLAYNGMTVGTSHKRGYRYDEEKGDFFRTGTMKNRRIFSMQNQIPTADFKRLPIQIELGDFQQTLTADSDRVAYCDPPYFGREDLYATTRKHGFAHEALAAIVKHRGNCILSYNDVPEIRNLYSGCHIDTVEMVSGFLKPGLKTTHRRTELLIFT